MENMALEAGGGDVQEQVCHLAALCVCPNMVSRQVSLGKTFSFHQKPVPATNSFNALMKDFGT